MKKNALVITSSDNVATAIRDISSNSEAVIGRGDETITADVVEDIALGHKFAIRDISEGEDVVKYNCVIGRATRDIKIGEHAHVHNMESLRGRGDLS